MNKKYVSAALCCTLCLTGACLGACNRTDVADGNNGAQIHAEVDSSLSDSSNLANQNRVFRIEDKLYAIGADGYSNSNTIISIDGDSVGAKVWSTSNDTSIKDMCIVGNKLYFIQVGAVGQVDDMASKICRCDLDGSDIEVVYEPDLESDNEFGVNNAVSNLTSDGLHLYFTQTGQNSVSIYLLGVDDNAPLRICETDSRVDIDKSCVCAGNLYCSGIDVAESLKPVLYKCALDGSGQEVISTNDMFVDAMMACNNKLYCACSAELTDLSKRGSYLIELDPSSGESRTIFVTDNARIFTMNIQHDVIYFVESLSNVADNKPAMIDAKLYSCDMDGNNKTELAQYALDQSINRNGEEVVAGKQVLGVCVVNNKLYVSCAKLDGDIETDDVGYFVDVIDLDTNNSVNLDF